MDSIFVEDRLIGWQIPSEGRADGCPNRVQIQNILCQEGQDVGHSQMWILSEKLEDF